MVRPRVFAYSTAKMIELGQEMVEFVNENIEDILHLSEWYTIEKGYTYNEWKNFIQIEEFLPYYEQALKIIGKKYVNKNSNVRDKISDRRNYLIFSPALAGLVG